MGRLITVTSRKGGVGKSSVALHLAASLARQGNGVLLVDLDAGMRCLDLLLGLSDSLVFDLGDVISGEKAFEEAIMPSKLYPGVSLVAAPLSGKIAPDGLKNFLENLPEKFDFVILDFPAGCVDELYYALPKYTEALVVCNADAVSIRDAGLIGKDLEQLNLLSVRLVLNRADLGHMKKGFTANIDEVIDRCGIRLIAVIPQSADIYYAGCTTTALPRRAKAYKAFERLARRILGYDIPLRYKKL